MSTIELSDEEALALIEEGLEKWGSVASVNGHELSKADLEEHFTLSSIITGKIGITINNNQIIDIEDKVFKYERKFSYEIRSSSDDTYEITFYLSAEFDVEYNEVQWGINPDGNGHLKYYADPKISSADI